ncbi:hypothetical protein GLOIN_2v1649325, partial [Rhizophagus irregularis DAOM 181602=DAOM 197198]
MHVIKEFIKRATYNLNTRFGHNKHVSEFTEFNSQMSLTSIYGKIYEKSSGKRDIPKSGTEKIIRVKNFITI